MFVSFIREHFISFVILKQDRVSVDKVVREMRSQKLRGTSFDSRFNRWPIGRLITIARVSIPIRGFVFPRIIPKDRPSYLWLSITIRLGSFSYVIRAHTHILSYFCNCFRPILTRNSNESTVLPTLLAMSANKVQEVKRLKKPGT